ncbi:MAG TPA: pitrilysin family protein [Thermoanaerobaculia bacterium]|jgi:predicted Zn-dependent peptidase|nr:pitrilysin family protein [Thermoanaerobaculia bacterium]
MRRATRAVAALLLLLLAIPVPAQTAAAATANPDRSKPPALGPVRPLKLPPVQKLSLGNGVAVLLVEQHEVPVVQLNVVARAGAGADPRDKPGLASLTADMLDEGAGSRSALQIADELDYLGADLQARAGWDSTSVALHVPLKRFAAALPIFADVALEPTFPAAELERVRKDRLTELLQLRDEPRAIASVAFANALYGRDHRYGTPVIGTEASVRGFSRADLAAFHERTFTPANSAIVVVGDVTAAFVQRELEQAFGGWKAPPGIAPAAVPAAPQVQALGIWIVDRPGSAQSEIRIGRIGPPRSTPDYFPLTVMNTILGGSFTSRLMQNLREQHGYAYGARSSFDYRLSTGPFVAAAAVQTDKTAPALTEFFKELEAIRKTVTEAEVAKAKNYVALSFPSDVETTGDLAGKLEEQFVYGLPDGWLDSYVAKVGAVTLADVKRVAEQYVDPAKVAIVVVGDRQKIEPPMRALNLGPIRVQSVEEVFGVAKK